MNGQSLTPGSWPTSGLFELIGQFQPQRFLPEVGSLFRESAAVIRSLQPSFQVPQVRIDPANGRDVGLVCGRFGEPAENLLKVVLTVQCFDRQSLIPRGQFRIKSSTDGHRRVVDHNIPGLIEAEEAMQQQQPSSGPTNSADAVRRVLTTAGITGSDVIEPNRRRCSA